MKTVSSVSTSKTFNFLWLTRINIFYMINPLKLIKTPVFKYFKPQLEHPAYLLSSFFTMLYLSKFISITVHYEIHFAGCSPAAYIHLKNARVFLKVQKQDVRPRDAVSLIGKGPHNSAPPVSLTLPCKIY